MDKFLPTLILLNHLVGLWLFRHFTSDEIEANKVMIEADGANSTLNGGFHERRTWIRFWGWLGCTLLGAVPAAALGGWELTHAADPMASFWATLGSWFFWKPVAWSFAALGVLLAGYFLRTFSPMLNAALNLAYKPRFYVSWSATASMLDRTVWALSATKFGQWLVKLDDRKQRANKLFQYGLNLCLVLTLLVYAVLALPLLRLI